MQWKLRTLLVALTVVSVAMALASHRFHQRRHRAARELTFFELRDLVSALDEPLQSHILEMPAVKAELTASDPINPSIALGRSILGSSMSVGQPIYFERTYRFDWQGRNGERHEGIRFSVHATLNTDGSAPHLLSVCYAKGEFSRDVAGWFAAQIRPLTHTQVELIEKQRQLDKFVLESAGPAN